MLRKMLSWGNRPMHMTASNEKARPDGVRGLLRQPRSASARRAAVLPDRGA